MSYYFAGTTDKLTVSLGTSRTQPITVACWVRFATADGGWPAGDSYIFNLGASSSSINNSALMMARVESAGSDRMSSYRVNNAASTTQLIGTFTAGDRDDGWFPYVSTYIGNGDAAEGSAATYVTNRLYHGTGATEVNTNITRIITGSLQHLSVGLALSGASNAYKPYIAEVAIWTGELSGANAATYCGGTSADQIDASNLLAYWTLKDDATKAAGSDSVGSLSVTGATQDASHPTIDYGTTNAPRAMHLYNQFRN